MGKKPLIQVEDVSFQYLVNKDEKIPVLKNISFNIYPGEYVAIIGHNGSGKSTLSKHLNGILKPSQGEVLVNGMNTKEKRLLKRIRQEVGMVFQNPDNQLIATTVEDDVAFGLENTGVPMDEMESRIRFALDVVGMSEMSKRAPHHLSGGQKQRVAIAGIIAMMPKCLVLDEATSMLDTYGRKDILKVIRKLNDDGMAIITVTHHMSEVAEADRVIVIEGGNIVLQGTPREIFQKKAFLQNIQLDVPAASRIAELVHHNHANFNPEIIHSYEIVNEVKRLLKGGENEWR
ncbi:energy-coupling factor transporter ATPase [Terrilactibacillus laevilacticus]|uniref:ABC transporter ATP-binding protein n=1 Tax=Terrilactibacillus laevilacticus TaxID=1380157 RepID=A0ABW5PRH7_9BACI